MAGLGGAVFWLASAPRPLSAAAIPEPATSVNKDERIANGKRIYHAGGCISCHKPPEGKEDPKVPSGGHPLKTPVGVFYPPNLTPDAATGLGNWRDLDFANAMMRGISPGGQHYWPVFPYTSYAKMRIEDVLDLKAYLDSLPAVQSPDVQPRSWIDTVARRGIGAWKRLGLDTTPFSPDPARTASWNEGAYLVNGPGHCSECHTPRNLLMVGDQSRFLAGGPHPAEKAKVRSLRGLIARKRFTDAKDFVGAFKFPKESMESGGMGSVQTNLKQLPDEDLYAIAEYLLSLE